MPKTMFAAATLHQEWLVRLHCHYDADAVAEIHTQDSALRAHELTLDTTR